MERGGSVNRSRALRRVRGLPAGGRPKAIPARWGRKWKQPSPTRTPRHSIPTAAHYSGALIANRLSLAPPRTDFISTSRPSTLRNFTRPLHCSSCTGRSRCGFPRPLRSRTLVHLASLILTEAGDVRGGKETGLSKNDHGDLDIAPTLANRRTPKV